MKEVSGKSDSHEPSNPDAGSSRAHSEPVGGGDHPGAGHAEPSHEARDDVAPHAANDVLSDDERRAQEWAAWEAQAARPEAHDKPSSLPEVSREAAETADKPRYLDGISVTEYRAELAQTASDVRPEKYEKFFEDEKKLDGHFLGPNGASYEPTTDWRKIEGFKPDNGREPQEGAKILYVNGIWTDAEGQRKACQDLANATGVEVVALHNSTELRRTDLRNENQVKDLFQCVGDKLDWGKNPAVDNIARTVEESVRKGEVINVIGHSHGALELSRALRHAERDLMRGGMSRREVQERMHTYVHAVSIGGAGMTWPDGPQYTHYVNTKDLVPMKTGVGGNPFKATHGRDAHVVKFTEDRGSIKENHSVPLYAQRLRDEHFLRESKHE